MEPLKEESLARKLTSRFLIGVLWAAGGGGATFMASQSQQDPAHAHGNSCSEYRCETLETWRRSADSRLYEQEKVMGTVLQSLQRVGREQSKMAAKVDKIHESVIRAEHHTH